ncbi:hypothetical protein [Kineosporia succinea]|uniref:Uncharacterized protein n=1 Tax=Kineosporia succinea TaxID=84632 RepID=A0ABT9P7Q9_9ACTN|nr:hypothetical protein [Kineosporia succinea]MDP9828723.1 hypothetical protein [Kineosporia succinea]
MQRRSSSPFLRLTVAFAIAVALITTTMRAEPGRLSNPLELIGFHHDTGCQALVVEAPDPTASGTDPGH